MSKPKKPKMKYPQLSEIGKDARDFNYKYIEQGLDGGGILPAHLQQVMMHEQGRAADLAYKENFGGLMNQIERFAPGDSRVSRFGAESASLAHGVEKDQIKQSFKEQRAQDREMARGMATDAVAAAKGIAAQSTAMYNQAAGQYNQTMAQYGTGMGNMMQGAGSLAGWMAAGQQYARSWDPLTTHQANAQMLGMGPMNPTAAAAAFQPAPSTWTQFGNSFMGGR